MNETFFQTTEGNSSIFYLGCDLNQVRQELKRENKSPNTIVEYTVVAGIPIKNKIYLNPKTKTNEKKTKKEKGRSFFQKFWKKRQAS